MRRWFEMFSDPSQTTWRYKPGTFGHDPFNRSWIAMPPKQQFISWLNASTHLYLKAAIASPGANPDFVCGSSEVFPNPDKNFQIVENWFRSDLFVFTAIYPTTGLVLLTKSATKPHSDNIDPNWPPWKK